MAAMKGQNTTIHKTRQHVTKHNDIQQNLLIRPVASAIILLRAGLCESVAVVRYQGWFGCFGIFVFIL